MVSEGTMEWAHNYLDGVIDNIANFSKKRLSKVTLPVLGSGTDIIKNSSEKLEGINQVKNVTNSSIDSLKKYGDFHEKRESGKSISYFSIKFIFITLDAQKRRELASNYVSNLLDF